MTTNTNQGLFAEGSSVKGIMRLIKRDKTKNLRKKSGVPVMVQQKWIWVVSMRMQVWSLASISGVRIWRCRELWCWSQMWLGSHVLWPWCRQAATAWIRPLAWESPYAVGRDIKWSQKRKEKKRKEKKRNQWDFCHEAPDLVCPRWFFVFLFVCFGSGYPTFYFLCQILLRNLH